MDVQTIVDIEDCVRYMTKYAAKAETKSQTAKQIFKTCVSRLSQTSQACNVVRSAMIKSIGERDFSAQEAAHMLLGLPLYSCTYTFVTVHLDEMKTVEIHREPSRTVMSTKLSIVEFYAQRAQSEPTNQTVNQMNLLQYSRRFYVQNNSVKERKTEVIVRTYPSYSSNPKSKHYPQYCKYQLIKYKPWQSHFSNAWNDLPDSDETYIAVYHEFIKSDIAALHLPQLEGELQLIEEYLQNSTADEYELDESQTENEQEEWMLLSQLNPVFHDSLDSTDNVNWHTAITTVTSVQIRDSANWINASRKDSTTQTYQHNCIQIDSSTLNEEQKLAYDIVTKHHQAICCYTTNPIENEAATNPEQLLMIIYGTAGTGKSYLIDAIASELKHDCCITATTGIAAFNINGVTIHSLLQLPIRNQGAKEL